MRLQSLVPGCPQDALKFHVSRTWVRNKERVISRPSDELRILQNKFRDFLIEQAGNVEQSVKRNALAHTRGRHFYQLDLKDAFPSLKPERLVGVLFTYAPALLKSEANTYERVVEFLQRYCFAPGVGLAQGGPVSPLLFDLYARYWLDRPFAKLAKEWKRMGLPPVLYRRYVDDLTFSSNESFSLPVRRQIRRVIAEAGFRINDRKASNLDITKNVVVVTGIALGGAPQLAEGFYLKFERQLDRFLKDQDLGVSLHSFRGNLNWFLSTEKQVEGTHRNRRVRRIHAKVSETESILRERYPKKPRGRMRFRVPQAWRQQLRVALPIVPYVRESLPHYGWAPKATGVRCPCPFCSARGETFSAHPKTQSYHCRSCKAHGDVFAFAMAHNKWDYLTAVVELAKLAGMPLPKEYLNRFSAPVEPAAPPSIVPAVQMTLFPMPAKRQGRKAKKKPAGA